MKQTVFAAVVALAIVVFALQNSATVPVHFLFWGFDCSMALLLVTVLVLGIFVGLTVTASGLRKKSAALKAANKKAAQLEKAISRGTTQKP